MSKNRSTIAVSLSPRTIERVRAEADRCCVSVSAIVSLALAEYLHKSERSEALYADTDSVKEV